MMKYSVKFANYLLLFLFCHTLSYSNSRKEHLIKQLYDIGVITFGNFTLKSGQPSSFYIDMRLIISYPEILQNIIECMNEIINACDYDCICGVPYSGLVIATAVSLAHQKPMILKRKEAKTYGTQKMIEGVYKSGDRCLVIEDVITTGQSILETTKELQNHNLQINDVIVLIARQQSGIETVIRSGHQVHALLTLQEIAEYLYQNHLITDQEYISIL